MRDDAMVDPVGKGRRDGWFSWTRRRTWVLVSLGLCAFVAAVWPVPHRLISRRVVEDIRHVLEATREGATQAGELPGLAGHPWMDSSSAQRRLQAMNGCLLSPLTVLDPAAEPLVRGMDGELKQAVRALRTSPALAPDMSGWVARHPEYPELLARVAVLVATTHAARGNWAEAIRGTSETAALHGALTRGAGWREDVLAQRGRFLQAVAGWHGLQPPPEMAPALADLLEGMASSDPSIGLLSLLHEQATALDTRVKSTDGGPMEAAALSWISPQLFYDRPWTEVPMGMRVGGGWSEEGQEALARMHAGINQPLRSPFDALAIEGRFWHHVRQVGDRHFAGRWKQLEALSQVPNRALLRVGLSPKVPEAYRGLSVARNQRLVVLASYCIMEWGMDPHGNADSHWWEGFLRRGGETERNLLKTQDVLEDPRRLGDLNLPQGAYQPRAHREEILSKIAEALAGGDLTVTGPTPASGFPVKGFPTGDAWMGTPQIPVNPDQIWGVVTFAELEMDLTYRQEVFGSLLRGLVRLGLNVGEVANQPRPAGVVDRVAYLQPVGDLGKRSVVRLGVARVPLQDQWDLLRAWKQQGGEGQTTSSVSALKGEAFSQPTQVLGHYGPVYLRLESRAPKGILQGAVLGVWSQCPREWMGVTPVALLLPEGITADQLVLGRIKNTKPQP